MSKNSSAKYYQGSKERLQKKLMKDIKVFLKKKKKENNNMVVKDTKISHKLKNKSYLSIEKNIIKQEKAPYCNYKKLFSFRKFSFFFGLG